MKTESEKLKLAQKKLRIARAGLRMLSELYQGTEDYSNIAADILDEMKRVK
jgi:hypothetical protein